MTATIEQQCEVVTVVCRELNELILQKGQLRNSDYIKRTHEFTNWDWAAICQAGLEIDRKMFTAPYFPQNCQRLLDHIERYGHLHSNCVTPPPKELAELGKKIKYISPQLTVKSVAWQTLMDLREIYCRIIDLDLPNDDSSQRPDPLAASPSGLFEFN